jgi:hypothetical protein
MPANHYYPRRLLERGPWHTNFAAQAAENGTTYGLSPADVAQIQLDAENVRAVVAWSEAVDGFAQAVTAYRDALFLGNRNVPAPIPPVAPPGIAPAVGSMNGIVERTRRFIRVIKAAPGYTRAVGESYGVVPPERARPGTPRVSAEALSGTRVRLRLFKAGYSFFAIDSRRGSGGWEQVGYSSRAVYLDDRAPLVAGQPEQREYRVQGIVGNTRTGDLSDVASVVTVP